MDTMKYATLVGTLALALCLAATNAPAQVPHHSVHSGTWYEQLLSRWNANDFDYGQWFERRREAFLDATVSQPEFWYSLVVTAWSVILTAACAKLSLDSRRRMRVVAEMLADLYNHDLLSREIAKEAVEKYNRHIEECNRAEEASRGVDGRPGWGETRVDTLKAELQRVANQLEATTQERNKLQEELRQKSLIVSDLSLRLDVLAKKFNGPRSDERNSTRSQGTGDAQGVVPLVGHINHLQEELYAERQKNRRLKGT